MEKWYENMIHLYVDGEVNEMEREKVEKRMINEPEYKRKVEEIKKYREMMSKLEIHSPSTPMVFEIMEEINGRNKRRNAGLKFQPALYLVVVILLTISIYGTRQNDKIEIKIRQTEETKILKEIERNVEKKQSAPLPKIDDEKKKKLGDKIILQKKKSAVKNRKITTQSIPHEDRIKIPSFAEFRTIQQKDASLHDKTKNKKIPKKVGGMESPMPMGAFNREDIFLKKEEYSSNSMDLTIKLKKNEKLYKKLRKILDDNNYSYLESEFGDNFEILIHVSEKEWEKLSKKLNRDFMLEKSENEFAPLLYMLKEREN